MPSIRFVLTVPSDPPEEHRAEANKVAQLLAGITSDIGEVCKNIAQEDVETGWDEKLASCRIFVVAPPTQGSVGFPCATEDSEVPWGERSVKRYVAGLHEMRSQIIRSPNGLPKGFSYAILERVRGYYALFDSNGSSNSYLTLTLSDDSEPPVVLDAQLRAVIDSRLAQRHQPVPHDLVGHSVHGILCEVADYNYGDPNGTLKFEVDPGDGTKWVCTMNKKDLLVDITRYWTKPVVVTGVARFRPQKPQMDVEHFRLIDLPAGENSLDRFTRLAPNPWKGVSGEEYMDEIRERD